MVYHGDAGAGPGGGSGAVALRDPGVGGRRIDLPKAPVSGCIRSPPYRKRLESAGPWAEGSGARFAMTELRPTTPEAIPAAPTAGAARRKRRQKDRRNRS